MHIFPLRFPIRSIRFTAEIFFVVIEVACNLEIFFLEFFRHCLNVFVVEGWISLSFYDEMFFPVVANREEVGFEGEVGFEVVQTCGSREEFVV